MQQERKIYLPYMLSYLAKAQFTGVLTLFEGEQQRAVYLNQGKPVHVRSSLVEETLGRLLLDQGKITTQQYEQLLEMMVNTGRQAGELLISIGALGPHEVFSALESQTEIKLNNCFRMLDFGFSLQSQAVPPALLIASIEVRDAILSGIQNAYSLGRLLNELPVHEESHICDRRITCSLGPREQKLLRQIGDGAMLADLLSPENDLTYVVSAVYCLHSLLCIEIAGINWPRPDDLELGDLDIPTLAAQPGFTALEQPQGLDLLADWDSEPPPQDEEEAADETIEPASAPSLAQTRAPETQAPDPGDDFSAPPTQAVIQAGLVTPKLARKLLSMSTEDHFTLLGLSRNAGEAEIKQAYHRTLNAYGLDRIDATYASEKERELAERLLDQVTIALRELSEDTSRKAYVAYLRQNINKEHREPPAHILADVEAQKGKAAMGAKNYTKARKHLEAAVRLNPNEPDHLYNLGRLDYHEALERTPAGQKIPSQVAYALLRAVELNSRHDKARTYLGYIYKRNGDLQAALREFKTAKESNPANRIAGAEIRLVEQKIIESQS